MQITPKALTALQKLLSVNSPIHGYDRQNQEHSESQSLQKSIPNLSGGQFESINNKLKQKLQSPKAIESTSKQNAGKHKNIIKHSIDVKNELINALKSTQNQSIKQKALKKNGITLNQLLSPQHKNTLKLKSEKNSYQKKRPPQLVDFGEEEDQNLAKNIMSSKSVQKSPNSISKYPTGFFTSTHQKQSGLNVFGSLNEVLRQYIQTKSQQKQAGTGEGVKIGICQSARNAENKKDKNLFLSENKKLFDAKQHDFTHLLSALYFKTSKILHAYQTKEALWKQQKKSLREEAKFLKQLLQQHQNAQQK